MSSRMGDSAADSPQTVDEARDAVTRSRQRISSTLDELEGRIVDTKQEIRERVDVLRPVREQIAQRPWVAVAIGAGVGAFLGSLGGGDDEDSLHRRRSGRVSGSTLSDEDRQELKEWRRMRRRRLRAARQAGQAHREDSWRESNRFEGDDDGDSRFDALKHQLLGALTSAVTTAVTRRVRRMALDNVGNVVESVFGGDHDERDSRDHDHRFDRPHHDGRGSARSGERERDVRYAARDGGL